MDSIPATFSETTLSGSLMLLICGAISILAVALALYKGLEVLRFRGRVQRVDAWVLDALRRGDLDAARKDCDKVSGGVGVVFTAGLDRALGAVRGEPAMAMRREEKRVMGQLRGGVWLLGSAGALMPFVGLLGTVLGVMAAFREIGNSAASGFDVVASGISEALIATAAGLFVALEAVVLYNVLQNLIAAQGRALSLLVDEAIELLRVGKAP